MAEESAAEPPPRHSEREHLGVLEIARYRKDDGRSLILYSHPEDADAASGPPAAASPGEGDRT